VIRRNPAPGTPAYDAMEARKREHNKRAGRPADEGLAGAGDAEGDTLTDRRPGQRQQPKRQSRSDRKTGPVAGEPVASSNGQAADAPTSSTPQQNAAKKPQAGAAKKQPAGKKGSGAKRQPAAKTAAQRRAAQKKPGSR
jgi:YidC/Oxa1 family membrane protein insertase